MKAIEEIGVKALKEHIIKNWMTHDAMRFFKLSPLQRRKEDHHVIRREDIFICLMAAVDDDHLLEVSGDPEQTEEVTDR